MLRQQQCNRKAQTSIIVRLSTQKWSTKKFRTTLLRYLMVSGFPCLTSVPSKTLSKRGSSITWSYLLTRNLQAKVSRRVLNARRLSRTKSTSSGTCGPVTPTNSTRSAGKSESQSAWVTIATSSRVQPSRKSVLSPSWSAQCRSKGHPKTTSLEEKRMPIVA